MSTDIAVLLKQTDRRVIDDSLYLERNVPTSRLIRNPKNKFVAYLNSYNLCNFFVPRVNFPPRGFLRSLDLNICTLTWLIPRGPPPDSDLS